MSPVIVPPAKGSFVAILLFTVVEKFASCPNASLSSFNVSKLAGAELTKSATSESTYAFTDCCVGTFVSLLDTILSSSTTKPIGVVLVSVFITAPAASTLAVSVTSACASIAANFDFSASV